MESMLVAPIPLLFDVMEVGKNHKTNYHRNVIRWKRLHGWTCNDIDYAKRRGPDRVKGGKEEYVATREVLKHIYDKY